VLASEEDSIPEAPGAAKNFSGSFSNLSAQLRDASRRGGRKVLKLGKEGVHRGDELEQLLEFLPRISL